MSDAQPNQPTGGLVVLQTILRKPYSDIRPFEEWLKENATRYLIGEHEADLEIQTTHCHILIVGLKVTRESLRKIIQKVAPGQGQNCTMARTQKKPRNLYDEQLLMDYILKGSISHHRSSSYTEEQLTNSASKWVHHEPVASEAINKDNAQQGGVKERPKQNKYEDCHQILDQYFTASEEYPDAAIDTQTPEGRARIPAAIIHWANKTRKAMNSYLVADYYDIILQQAVPEYYHTLCADIINQRHRFSHN